jgi:hypothetical protein
MSSNSQIIELYGSLIEPSVLFLTWSILSNDNPDVNAYYIITYNNYTTTTTSMNIRLPVDENTTHNISVASVTTVGNLVSSPSNIIQITTSSNLNLPGLNSGLRPFSRLLSYQLNIERTCDNAKAILPYPTFIDNSKQPFYQYYKIKPNCI